MQNPQLTASQKYTLRWIGPYEFSELHSNGDVTVRLSSGVNLQMVRISNNGMIIKRTSASGEQTTTTGWKSKSLQPSLSDELTQEIKPPEKKIPKKTLEKQQYVSYTTTICQENPECCKPRAIKHVAWDADHTIWNMPGTAASVTGKLKKIDDNTVVEIGKSYTGQPSHQILYEEDLPPEEATLLKGLSQDEKDFLLDELSREHGKVSEPGKGEEYRTTIKLFPTFRQTLDELDKRGISSSIISLNTPGSVKRILKEFGLDNRFVEIRDSYENKGSVFKDITHKLGVCPCDAIFVDDTRGNVHDVVGNCGMGLQIGKDKDISEPIEVLKFIKD